MKAGTMEFDGTEYPGGIASDPHTLQLMQGSPPPLGKRIRFEDDRYLEFPQIRWSLSHMRELVPTAGVWRGVGAASDLGAATPEGEARIDALTFEDMQGRRRTWADSLAQTYADGIIVLHDCNPATAMIGFPATSYEDFRAQNRWQSLLWLNLPPWSGDVWKAIVALRSTSDALRVAVLKCDFGVGIVRRGAPESRLSYSAEEIAALAGSAAPLRSSNLSMTARLVGIARWLHGQRRRTASA